MQREKLIADLRRAADSFGGVHLADDTSEGRRTGRGQSADVQRLWFGGVEHLAINAHPYGNNGRTVKIGTPEEIADWLLARRATDDWINAAGDLDAVPYGC